MVQGKSGQVINELRYQLISLSHYNVVKQKAKSFLPSFHTWSCVAKTMKCLSNFAPAEAQAPNLMMLIAVISLAVGEQLRCCLDMGVHSDTFC